MKKIKYSYVYEKMKQPFSKVIAKLGRLVFVHKTRFELLDPEFAQYDTLYLDENGKEQHYPLPKKGACLVLFFFVKEGAALITTIRTDIMGKAAYYENCLGSMFEFKIVKEEPKPKARAKASESLNDDKFLCGNKMKTQKSDKPEKLNASGGKELKPSGVYPKRASEGLENVYASRRASANRPLAGGLHIPKPEKPCTCKGSKQQHQGGTGACLLEHHGCKCKKYTPEKPQVFRTTCFNNHTTTSGTIDLHNWACPKCGAQWKQTNLIKTPGQDPAYVGKSAELYAAKPEQKLDHDGRKPVLEIVPSICSHCLRCTTLDYCAICGKAICQSCADNGIQCR